MATERTDKIPNSTKATLSAPCVPLTEAPIEASPIKNLVSIAVRTLANNKPFATNCPFFINPSPKTAKIEPTAIPKKTAVLV